MAVGVIEKLIPSDDGDVERGIAAAEMHANGINTDVTANMPNAGDFAEQDAVDEEISRLEGGRAFEPIQVGAMFPGTRPIHEAVRSVRRYRGAVYNSGHLILRYPSHPPIY